VAAIFDPRVNAIGGLRLLLAMTVVVGHALPLTGAGSDLGRADNNSGALAVEAFFALSGFLVTRSASNGSGTPRFLLRRLARVVPGFWGALLATACVFAPLAALLGPGGFVPIQSLHYVTRNWLLVVHQDGIGTTLSGVPYSDNWNVPLWTINFEMDCYVLVAVLAATRALRLVALAPLAAAAMATLLLVPMSDDRPFRFFVCFLVGSLAWTCRRRLPATASVLVGALLVAALTYVVGGFVLLGLPCFAYAVVLLAIRRPFTRVGTKNDLSYGTYVYGWPVGQLLMLAGASRAGLGAFMLADVCLTLAIAALSWHYVEQPAITLVRRRRADRARGAKIAAGIA
jgi:peptidoglycan/LPS O-acetylase OafA/YrhL